MKEEKKCLECEKILLIEDYPLQYGRTKKEIRAYFKRRQFCCHKCAVKYTNKHSPRRYTHIVTIRNDIKIKIQEYVKNYDQFTSCASVIKFLLEEHEKHCKEKKDNFLNRKNEDE